MKEPKRLGALEHLILLAIRGLDGNSAYGAAIYKRLRSAGRQTSIGAVHSTLDALELKGVVSSKLGEPTRVRGGKAKKLFRISRDGEDALREAERSIQTLRELVPAL